LATHPDLERGTQRGRIKFIMNAESEIEVPREHRRPEDNQDTFHRHYRQDGRKMNNNGTVQKLIIVVITGAFTFFMTMYFNARAMEDKYVKLTDFQKVEGKIDTVYNYVIGKIAIEQEQERKNNQ